MISPWALFMLSSFVLIKVLDALWASRNGAFQVLPLRVEVVIFVAVYSLCISILDLICPLG